MNLITSKLLKKIIREETCNNVKTEWDKDIIKSNNATWHVRPMNKKIYAENINN